MTNSILRDLIIGAVKQAEVQQNLERLRKSRSHCYI